MCLFLQAGCRTKIVRNNSLESTAGIPRLGQNAVDYGPTVEEMSRTGMCAGNAFSAHPAARESCRIKYHPSYDANHWMVVEGKLDNGRKYPLILDTGASVALFVNDIHIAENRLPIDPIRSSSQDAAGWGRCRLSNLHVGDVILNGWPCFYREQHTEFQLFGLPLVRDKAMIAGLPVLRSFRYVMFDSITREVELSLDRSFRPEHAESWTAHPLRIEEDRGGNVFLFVEIPIGGRRIELQLDTGSGGGLAICDRAWRQIRRRIGRVKLRGGTDLYPYIGRLPCRKATVDNLKVGSGTIPNARVSIFPNDSPIMENCSGIVGMQYFRDTAIVLDFGRGLMWIMNSSRG